MIKIYITLPPVNTGLTMAGMTLQTLFNLTPKHMYQPIWLMLPKWCGFHSVFLLKVLTHLLLTLHCKNVLAATTRSYNKQILNAQPTLLMMIVQSRKLLTNNNLAQLNSLLWLTRMKQLYPKPLQLDSFAIQTLTPMHQWLDPLSMMVAITIPLLWPEILLAPFGQWTLSSNSFKNTTGFSLLFWLVLVFHSASLEENYSAALFSLLELWLLLLSLCFCSTLPSLRATLNIGSDGLFYHAPFLLVLLLDLFCSSAKNSVLPSSLDGVVSYSDLSSTQLLSG